MTSDFTTWPWYVLIPWIIGLYVVILGVVAAGIYATERCLLAPLRRKTRRSP